MTPMTLAAPKGSANLRQNLIRWAPLLIVACVYYAYSNSIKGEFVFDDDLTILGNRAIRTLWPPWVSMFPHGQSGTAGRPLTGLSFAINYAIDGYRSRGYHIGNLIVHSLTVLTLWGVLRRTFSRLQHARAEGIALGATLLWAVHPLLTDSVTYCTNRSEVLMGLFSLLALYAFVRSLDSLYANRWLALSVGCSLASIASKETGAMMPLVILIIDAVVISRAWLEPFRRRWIYYAALAGTMLFLPFTLVIGSFQNAGVLERQSMSSWTYLLLQSQVITRYLWLATWPSQLCICYVDWPVPASFVAVWPWMVLVSALFLVFAAAVIRRQRWGMLGAWFFLFLAPTSSILPIVEEPAGERRMYLPLIAVVVLAVVLAERATRRIPRSSAINFILLLVAVLSLGQVTLWRNEDFSDRMSIWSDAAVKRPGNYRAQLGVGLELLKQGRFGDSLQFFDRALQLHPDTVEALINRGTAYMYLRRFPEGLADLRNAVRLNPKHSQSWTTLGWALQIVGNSKEAEQCLRRAIELDPDDPLPRDLLQKPATVDELRPPGNR